MNINKLFTCDLGEFSGVTGRLEETWRSGDEDVPSDTSRPGESGIAGGTVGVGELLRLGDMGLVWEGEVWFTGKVGCDVRLCDVKERFGNIWRSEYIRLGGWMTVEAEGKMFISNNWEGLGKFPGRHGKLAAIPLCLKIAFLCGVSLKTEDIWGWVGDGLGETLLWVGDEFSETLFWLCGEPPVGESLSDSNCSRVFFKKWNWWKIIFISLNNTYSLTYNGVFTRQIWCKEYLNEVLKKKRIILMEFWNKNKVSKYGDGLNTQEIKTLEKFTKHFQTGRSRKGEI